MYIIFILLIIVLIFIIIKNSNKNGDESNPLSPNVDINKNLIDYKRYYKPKRYITTLNEMKFYTVLLEIVKELDYILFSQVSLYNIVSMQDNLDYSTRTRYFNKIASKSIDFVLVDEKCRIKLCIELDDTTHNQRNRIERDRFINELFKELDIPLLRYPVYNTYYKETLKKRIQENIKENNYTEKNEEVTYGILLLLHFSIST